MARPAWLVAVAVAIAPDAGAARQAGRHGVGPDRPTGSAQIAADGLVAAYDMETLTADGRLRDFGPHGNHAEVMGTTPARGRLGGARGFRVATDRIHLPEHATLAIDGPLTLAVRLRVATLDLHQHVLACDDKFALWITPGNRVRFSDTLGRGADTADPVRAGVWYDLVAVFTGAPGTEVTAETLRLYVNGERAGIDIVNRPGDVPPRWMPGPLYPTDACYIGFESHQGNAAHQQLPFSGDIDEVMIFGRALSASEVAAFGIPRQ